MKDPLQIEETPYEILGIGVEATDREIFAAFTAGMTARLNVQRLRAAKQVLDRREDRALLDLMQYDPANLRGLTPSPIDDPTVLDVAQRGETAASWEATLKATFPNLGAAHSLAVLWYWWALHEEARRGATPDEDGDGSPLPTELWERSIGCWSMLVASEEFWEARPRIGRENGRAIGERLVAALQGRLDGLARANRARGEASRADEYHRLAVALSTEVSTAKNLAAAEITMGNGPVCAGYLLLDRLQLLEGALRRIDAAVATYPGNVQLSSLRIALSPYGHIAALIGDGRAQEALDAIGRLPAGADATTEVADLEGQALVALGKQQSSMGQMDEALTHWSSALTKARSESVKAEARSAIVSACRDRAAALVHTNRNDAIGLLDRGLTLVDDPDLRSTLAEFLVRRGVEVFMNVQDQIEKDGGPPSKATISDLERALEDLDRGVELGSEGAREQAKAARSFLKQVKSGMIGLPKEVEKLLSEGAKAAGKKDWDTAIDRYRAAITALGANAPADLRKSLSVLLSNRANQIASKAMEMRRQAEPLFGNSLKDAYSAVVRDEKVESRTRKKAQPFGKKFGSFLLEGSLSGPFWLIFILGGILGGGDKAADRWLKNNPVGKAFFAIVITILALSLLLLLIRLGKALVDWTNRITAPYSYGRSYSAPREPEERCFCGSGASYRVTLAPGNEVNLCYTHKDRLEKQANALPPAAASILESAEDDFEEAAAWDPSAKGLRDELGAVRQMLGRTATQTRPGRQVRSVPAASAALRSTPATATTRSKPSSTTTHSKPAASPARPAPSRARSTSSTKVNLNTASADELATLPGIDGELAVRIVGYRDAHGGFSWAQEIKQVPGITDDIYMELRPHVRNRYLP